MKVHVVIEREEREQGVSTIVPVAEMDLDTPALLAFAGAALEALLRLPGNVITLTKAPE